MDMGLQIDPAAAAVSVSIMAGFLAVLVKLSALSSMKERRNDSAESLRRAKVSLLAGTLDLESYERAADDAKAAALAYEAAAAVPETFRSPRSRNEVPQMSSQSSVLDLDRLERGSRQPLEAPVPSDEGSQSEARSSLVGDLMFGFIMVQLVALFAFSTLPDPVMDGRPADPFCDPCAQLQAQKAAQSGSDGVAQSVTEQV
jgi:hypothetical protein